MGKYACKVCDDREANEAAAMLQKKGFSAAGVARTLTYGGFKVGDPTIVEHFKHAKPVVPEALKLPPRDAAIFVRDKLMDRVESMDVTDVDGIGLSFDITDKDLQPALKTMLTAQRDLDRRVGKTSNQQTQIAIAFILSGAKGGLAAVPEHLRIGDGTVIEGSYEEVDSVPS